MANWHGFWMNCLHCPLFFIVGVGLLIVGFGALLVSSASVCCKRQSQRPLPPEARRDAPGSEADVLHVVF